MVIDIYNTKCKVWGTPVEVAFLRQYLAFDDQSTAFRRGRDGRAKRVKPQRIYLFDAVDETFPTGLLSLVYSKVKEVNWTITFRDCRPPCPGPVKADLSWLRSYQLEAVEAAIKKGRGILHLPTGCLSGETIITVNRAGKSFKIRLADLVHRENGGETRGEPGQRPSILNDDDSRYWNPNIQTRVQSMTSDGFIRLHTLAQAVVSGWKVTYTVITESGKMIRATKDHRFLTDAGWKRLEELEVGDFVIVDNGRGPKGNRSPQRGKYYKIIVNLRHHPFASRRNIADQSSSYSVPYHRLVVEAEMNALPLQVFIKRIRSGNVAGMTFMDPKEISVHHIDGDEHNNTLENLEVIHRIDHSRKHGIENGWRRVTRSTTVDKIVSIECFGSEMTYDLVMDGDPHNFIANGIVVHNSGKTEIAAGLIKSFPVYWTFIVHRSGLMYQAAERFAMRGITGVGVLGDGKVEVGQHVTVTTFQTMWSQIKTPAVKELLKKTQGIIVDEVHTLPGPTWSQVAEAFQEARYRFGLSGTPLDRSDQRSLITVGSIGPVIHRTPADVLVDAGVLAKPRINMVRVDQVVERPTYQGIYGAGVIRSQRRNATLLSCIKTAQKPCLVFVTNLRHGAILLDEAKRAGMSAFFVRGDVEEAKRAELKDKLRSKTIDVVIASVVWQEGIDIPELASVVIAGGGKSVIAALQRVGRGMRRAAGKDTFEVWDISDVGTRTLENHSKARINAYTREGYEVRHVSFSGNVPTRQVNAAPIP